MQMQGAKSAQIEVALDISREALRSTLTLADIRTEGETQARSGARKSYTDAEELLMVRHVRLHPKDTYA